MKAASEYATELTVNEVEYPGLLLCFDLLADQDQSRVIICGDSNLVTRHMKGEINCKAPDLKLLRPKAMEKLRLRSDHVCLRLESECRSTSEQIVAARERGRSLVRSPQLRLSQSFLLHHSKGFFSYVVTISVLTINMSAIGGVMLTDLTFRMTYVIMYEMSRTDEYHQTSTWSSCTSCVAEPP